MSRTRIITFTLTLKVTNPAKFRKAARELMEEDDFDDELLTDCAIVLFDSGFEPEGCTVLSSSAEITP